MKFWTTLLALGIALTISPNTKAAPISGWLDWRGPFQNGTSLEKGLPDKIDGKKTMEIPAQASGYEKIECIYQKLPGWKTSTEGITRFDKLPKPARDYLAFLAKQAGAKIGMVSTGPDRDHTIVMEEFVGTLKTAVPGRG